MAQSTGLATRLLLVVWGTVEIFLFAGLIFGWASLVYVFKVEGIFSHVCESSNHGNGTNSTDSTESCKAQDEQFNLVYTLAVVITGVSLFATGWMFDKWGTRLCRTVGM